MKKIFVLLLALGLAGFTPMVMAQAERGPQQRGGGNFAERQLERMNEVLQLSEPQQEYLEAALTELQEGLEAAQDRESRREAMVALRESMNEVIEKALTEEQLEAWTAHLEELREQRGAGAVERRQRPARGEELREQRSAGGGERRQRGAGGA